MGGIGDRDWRPRFPAKSVSSHRGHPMRVTPGKSVFNVMN
jgi:hypothetical protein